MSEPWRANDQQGPTPGYDLLDKNELTVTDVELTDADLAEVAAAVAEVISLRREEVLVTDYRDRVLTLDVLRPDIYPHQLLGRDSALLERLRTVPGVVIGPAGEVSSRGMLGWIAADPVQGREALTRAEAVAVEMDRRIARRVAVLSTGAELVAGEVRDTNWATITAALEGFTCEHRGTVRDDDELIAGTIRMCVEAGFGLVITTGGVGAEDKDRTVEAVQRLDPGAFTPYLCRFEAGHGRHVKDGVRIAVGEFRGARIVSLPGPNDEVTVALQVLREGLATGWPSDRLAADLAEALRQILRDRMTGRHSHHLHIPDGGHR